METFGRYDPIADKGPPVKAHLKWFNGTKGFGFVIPEGNPVDAFLHITTLQQAGINGLGEGACLLCHVQSGPKGHIVTEVVEVIDAGAAAADLVITPSNNNRNPDERTRVMNGTVKWYKLDKGFGFVVPDDGMKDVFVHKSCIEKNGLDYLEAGQRVTMTIRCVPKGREALDVRLLAREDSF